MEARAVFKYLASFLKTSWDLEDYPIRLIRQEAADLPGSDERPVPQWRAQIMQWWQMVGLGDTPEEALAQLRERLAGYKQNVGALPRPGTHVPMQFAPSAGITRYEPIARDFLDRILNLDYDACFISDASSLGDFVQGGDDTALVERIRQVYGVDVADVEHHQLVGIFKRLSEQSTAA